MTRRPIILDTDDAVGALENEQRIALTPEWREKMRFGSRLASYWKALTPALAALPAADQQGTVFIGSGDFHHLSLGLVKRCVVEQGLTAQQGLRLVILDNHPDNMRFPFGIHCGSWVAHAARLPGVAHIDVIGVTSGDLGLAHAWEHHLSALYKKRITYWCMDVDTRWANRLGLASQFRHFDDMASLVDAAAHELARAQTPTYLSIDKDVFSPSVVRTNWDQGRMACADFDKLVAALAGTLVGSDVTGEVSYWHYQAAWKRWLSAADGQDTAATHAAMGEWQQQQARFNQHILEQLAGAWRD